MRQRSLLFTLILCVGLIGSAAAQNPASHADMAKTADAVKELDAKRFTAQTKNDFDALGTLLADDLVYTHSSAAVDGKSSFIDTMKSGRAKYEAIEPMEVKVRVYGNTAIINGLAKLTVTSNGATSTFSLRYTDVWVMRENKWQMVSWQSTRLPEPSKGPSGNK